MVFSHLIYAYRNGRRSLGQKERKKQGSIVYALLFRSVKERIRLSLLNVIMVDTPTFRQAFLELFRQSVLAGKVNTL